MYAVEAIASTAYIPGVQGLSLMNNARVTSFLGALGHPPPALSGGSLQPPISICFGLF